MGDLSLLRKRLHRIGILESKFGSLAQKLKRTGAFGSGSLLPVGFSEHTTIESIH